MKGFVWEEKIGNREPHKPVEISQIWVKSFHIRRLHKQPFPPPNAIRSHSSQVIFRKSRNSADGYISQCYFEHGPPVKIQEVTAKELKFGYCNMFDWGCRRYELSDLRVFMNMSCSCFSNNFLHFGFDSLTFSGKTFHLRTQNLTEMSCFSCSRLEGIK